MQKSCSMTPFAATKQMVGQMVGGVLLLVNLGLKLYSELKQTTVIKNKKKNSLLLGKKVLLAFIHGLFLTIEIRGRGRRNQGKIFLPVD